MENSKTFKVDYTKKIGGKVTIIVKAVNEANAIQNAKQHCFTGSDFRNARQTSEIYAKPIKQGFQGSQRQ